MQISLSDLVDSCSEEIYLELDTYKKDKGENLEFLKELKKVLEKYNKPTSQVEYLISELEGNTDYQKVINIFGIDEKRILYYIKKHPYFKNPCDYPIRLITIMKYLKKKEISLHYRDMDLIVDKLILQIDGVKKVGDGMYLKK
ncbi:hypothetical protein IZY60_00595 [Lutibacter sp. B2]|nr:hypothetical protein [Lutibacter sp. B2]